MSWSSSFSWALRKMLGVRGLYNRGLSCCVNALLQSFAATTELFDLLDRWQPSEDCKDHCNVPLQLKRALHAMKDQHQPAPHCDFLECLHHNHISYHIQHDADEVFHVILNLIEQQMSDPSLAAEIQNLYKITVDGQIHCLDCTYVHHVPTFFLSLPLHLRGERNTLEECIRSFFEVQALEDTESFYCDRCEKKQPTSQGFHIVSLPSILCIHLKRFRSENGFTRKLKCKVSFPESFDMADVLKEHQETIKGKYTLYAVVMHSGFATSGHYTAYVHCKQDKTWYYTNDNEVQQASWMKVQKTCGESNETAYMLLYRRETVEGSSG